MEADIGCAPGAEDNPLATWAMDLVAANVQRSERARRDFFAMRAAVAMVAPDRRLQATLRFDHGYLVIHDGMIGIPDVTFCGDYEVLMGLADLPLSRLGRLPLPPFSRSRMRAWRRTALEVATGELKIYGVLSHARLITRVLRILSKQS